MKRLPGRAWLAVALLVVLSAQDAAPGEKATFKRDSGPAKGLARDCGLKCVGRLRPRRSEQIVGSPWGVACHWIADKHELTTEQRLEQLAALGAKWALLVPNWDLVETAKGAYDWNGPAHRLDDAVRGCVKRKIAPIIQIYGGNRLYAPLSPLHKPPGVEVPKMTTDPAVKRAWYAFLEAMARRYHQQVKVWEVWNEPNIGWFWKPRPDAKAYSRMVKEVAEVIKGVDPKATILAGSTAMMPEGFFRGLLDGEGGNAFDHCSMHPYNAVPARMDGAIRQLQKLLASRNRSTVVWQTECGLPSNADTAGWGGQGPWDETKQAKWVLRRLLCDAAAGMKVSIYFILNDYPAIIEIGPHRGKVGPNRKGLYYWGSWEPKHARYAFQHLASVIDDRLDPRPTKVSFEIAQPGSFGGAQAGSIRTYALAEKQSGAPVLAYWLPVPMHTDAKAARVKLSLAAAGPPDPVLVDLLDGRVYAVAASPAPGGATILQGLPLADYPMVLCPRRLVELAAP